MGRTAHPHRVQARSHHIGHHVSALQNHSERPGPEAVCEGIGRIRDIPAVPLQPRRRRYMENERVVLGPALGRENIRHCLWVQSVGPQAIDGLRGDTQQTASPDDLRRRNDVIRTKTSCVQIASPDSSAGKRCLFVDAHRYARQFNGGLRGKFGFLQVALNGEDAVLGVGLFVLQFQLDVPPRRTLGRAVSQPSSSRRTARSDFTSSRLIPSGRVLKWMHNSTVISPFSFDGAAAFIPRPRPASSVPPGRR